MRRSLFALCLPLACFSEGGGMGSDASDDSSGTPSTSTTEGSTSTSMPPETSTEASTSSADDTTTSADVCTWPLEWAGTDRKDILVVVQQPPTNLGALVTRAEQIATNEGVHIAIASPCDEICMCCGNEGDGFEHHTIAIADDPLGQAAGVEVGTAFFRAGVPRRVVVLAGMDTTWTPEMLAADPLLGSAQLDVRNATQSVCGTTPALEALAMATHGSVACGDLVPTEVLDDAVLLAAQPACELFGDPAAGPPPGPIELALGLAGQDREGTMVSSTPPGPGVCTNAPDGWSILDAALGHLALCPLACRDVGDWDPATAGASIDFPC